jgi:lipopolysaccharide/colanic/teichoic acid biosynthesis glycosyltransferase
MVPAGRNKFWSLSRQLVMKRLLDIVVSVLALVVLSPLFLSVLLALKLVSSGPLFCVTLRRYNGRIVHVLTFRRGGLFHSSTRFESFLIRTGIDQLPALINVLRGDLSIIGPRSIGDLASMAAAENRPRISLHYTMKPGIISLADIRRSGRTNISATQRQVEYDAFYVRNWSPLLDVKILCLYLTSKAAYLMHYN